MRYNKSQTGPSFGRLLTEYYSGQTKLNKIIRKNEMITDSESKPDAAWYGSSSPYEHKTKNLMFPILLLKVYYFNILNY